MKLKTKKIKGWAIIYKTDKEKEYEILSYERLYLYDGSDKYCKKKALEDMKEFRRAVLDTTRGYSFKVVPVVIEIKEKIK